MVWTKREDSLKTAYQYRLVHSRNSLLRFKQTSKAAKLEDRIKRLLSLLRVTCNLTPVWGPVCVCECQKPAALSSYNRCDAIAESLATLSFPGKLWRTCWSDVTSNLTLHYSLRSRRICRFMQHTCCMQCCMITEVLTKTAGTNSVPSTKKETETGCSNDWFKLVTRVTSNLESLNAENTSGHLEKEAILVLVVKSCVGILQKIHN